MKGLSDFIAVLVGIILLILMSLIAFSAIAGVSDNPVENDVETEEKICIEPEDCDGNVDGKVCMFNPAFDYYCGCIDSNTDCLDGYSCPSRDTNEEKQICVSE